MGPCPQSRGSYTRGGRKHTRTLKSAWKRAANGDPKARSWLSNYGYALPPSPAEQAMSVAARRAAGPARSSPKANLVVWASLREGLTSWNDCPYCYSQDTSNTSFQTDQGFKMGKRCNACNKQFKPRAATF